MAMATDNGIVTWGELYRTLVPTINSMSERLHLEAGEIAKLRERLDTIERTSLPAPTPVEPAPAPETPDELATRLLSDPQMAAEVFLRFAVGADTMDREAFVGELMARCRHYSIGRTKVALFAPGIAAAGYQFA